MNRICQNGQYHVDWGSHLSVTHTEVGALVAFVNEDRLGEAERGARSLLAIYSDVGMLWKILSVALVRQGKDAIQSLRKAADLLPNDAEALSNLGSALHDRELWDEALKYLMQSLEIEPLAVQVLADAGNCLTSLGRAREAVPFYERALQLDPTLTEAHNNLGNAFMRLRDFDAAARCYRSALQRAPQNATIQCNLGTALRQCGLIDEAMASSIRALSLDPGLSAAHNNLGLIYAAQGRREEAVASYRQALALNPRYVDVLINLGNVLRDVGQRHEALSVYALAAEIDPGRADSQCCLGNILFELRRSDEAANAYGRALGIVSDYSPALRGLSTLLRRQRRAAEAELTCDTVLRADPKDVEALCIRGELYADRGRFSEAADLFRQATLISPDFAPAWCGLANYRRMTADDHAWQCAAESLLARALPLGHEINLYYALGKYFDDTAQYDTAFGHYNRANELSRRYGATYKASKLSQLIDEIIGTCDAAIGRRLDRISDSEIPVFIVGMPRSGTSLTEQILASHPAAFGAGELVFWETAYSAYKKAGGARRGGSTKLISSVVAHYLASLPAAAGGALKVTDKMPGNFLYAGLIHAAFPRARIIHLRRHPIDTCLSIYFHNFAGKGPYANDLENLASYYSEYIRVTDHWRSVIPANAWLDISYEALIKDPEPCIRRMLEFVGLPWHSGCLDFHLTDRVVLTTSKWQVRQRIHSSSLERWRHYERHAGPLRHLADKCTTH